MRRAFMGMMLKLRCNRRSGWGKGLLVQKKARMSRSKIKVLLVVFFDWKGTVHHEFVPRGQMVNRVVPGSFSAFEGCCAQEEAWIVGKPNLDVAPWQCAGSRVAPNPQLSGKTSDIHYTPSTQLKTSLKGRCFQTVEEIQEDAIRELCAITESVFQEAFQQWQKHWEQCIASRWDNFEGDSA